MRELYFYCENEHFITATLPEIQKLLFREWEVLNNKNDNFMNFTQYFNESINKYCENLWDYLEYAILDEIRHSDDLYKNFLEKGYTYVKEYSENALETDISEFEAVAIYNRVLKTYKERYAE